MTVSQNVGIKVRFIGNARGRIEQRWQRSNGRRYIFQGKWNENHELGTRFVHKRIISAVKRVELVSDKKSYITLRGRWCAIILLNVHASIHDKIDDMKGSFYEEVGRVFDEFPEYHMNISGDSSMLT
jgi:hypothetical protein